MFAVIEIEDTFLFAEKRYPLILRDFINIIIEKVIALFYSEKYFSQKSFAVTI